MGRLPILLLLLCIAAVINPAVRAQAEPYAKPHVDRALSPFYEWSVRHRLGEIGRALQAKAARGEGLPTTAGFELFLQSYYRDGKAHLDPWGAPFYLRAERGAVRAVSAGRDNIPDTADDVFSQRITL